MRRNQSKLRPWKRSWNNAMCVIAIAIKSPLALDVLKACERSNRDGGGVAWVENGAVQFRKGLTAAEIHTLIADKPLPHVVHFRIATVGGVSKTLCHPFTVKASHNAPLEGVAREVLFHNGHLTGWEFSAQLAGIGIPPGISDSQAIARIVAMRGESVLQGFVERGAGKFVVLKANGEAKCYGHFSEWNDGLYSNLHWKHGLSCNPTHHVTHFPDKPKKHGSYAASFKAQAQFDLQNEQRRWHGYED